MPNRDRRVSLWSRASAAVLAAGTFVAIDRSSAEACGPIMPSAHPLLPLPAAVNVPLNAVLIASSAYRTVQFALREVATGRVVPVSVACEAEGSVRLCQARPGLLAANTAYAWTAEPPPPDAIKPGVTLPTPAEQTFTTGAEIDDRPALTNVTPDPAPLLAIDLLEHARPTPSLCGGADIVRLRLTVAGLDEPVVLTAAGMGGVPDGPQPIAPVLTPAARSIERSLTAAPACLAVHLLDVAGNVTNLPPWCPPPGSGVSAGVTTPEPGFEAAACAAVPGQVSGAPGAVALGTGLALAILLARTQPRRRRR